MATTIRSAGLSGWSDSATAREVSDLPPGWESTFDNASGRTYYFNRATQETLWNPPPADAGAKKGAASSRGAAASSSKLGARDQLRASADARRKTREAQQREEQRRHQEELKRIRTRAGARVDDGDDEAAKSNTRGASATTASTAATRARLDRQGRPLLSPRTQRTSSATTIQAHLRAKKARATTEEARQRRVGLDLAELPAGKRDEDALARGLHSASDFISCLQANLSLPTPPLDKFRFVFDEEKAMATRRSQAKAEAMSAQQLRKARLEDADRTMPSNIRNGTSELDRKLWRAFCVADHDSSRTISRRELSYAFTMVGLNSSVAERKAVFEEADKDHSGQISWDEFRKLGHRIKQLSTLPTRPEADPLAGARKGLPRKATPKDAKGAYDDTEGAAVRIQAARRGRQTRLSLGSQRRAEEQRKKEAELKRAAAAAYTTAPTSKRGGGGGAAGTIGAPPKATTAVGGGIGPTSAAIGGGGGGLMGGGGVPGVTAAAGGTNPLVSAWGGGGSVHPGFGGGMGGGGGGGGVTPGSQMWATPYAGAAPQAPWTAPAMPMGLPMGGGMGGAPGGGGGLGAMAEDARMMAPEEWARRRAAAIKIQSMSRTKAARATVEKKRDEKSKLDSYRSRVQMIRGAEKTILSRASELVHGTSSGAAKGKGGGAKGGGAKGGGAKGGAKAGSGGGEAAKAKRSTKSSSSSALSGGKPKAETAKDIAAVQRALLATAFAAECRGSDDSISRRSLPKVLRRAKVAGADSHELQQDAELLGHVRMRFEEVAEVAHKLRSRARELGGTGLLGGASELLGAAEPAALLPSVREALARGFASCDDAAAGAIATSRLPQALRAGGLPTSVQALELPLGASLSDRARLDWRRFMQLASTLITLQPAQVNPLADQAVVTVRELHMQQAPVQGLGLPPLGIGDGIGVGGGSGGGGGDVTGGARVFLAARPAQAASEPPLPPLCSAPFALSASRLALGLPLQLPPGRALLLSLVAESGGGANNNAPLELLSGELSGPELQSALEEARASSLPATVLLPLYDAAPPLDAPLTQRATVSLAVAPANMPNAVPPPLASGGGAPFGSGTAGVAVAAPAADDDPGAYSVEAQRALAGRPEPPGLDAFEKRLWAAFCLSDVDESNHVSKREFYEVLARVGIHPTERDKLLAFNQADKDHSGQISWDEFRKAGKRLKKLGDAPSSRPAGGAAGGGGAARSLDSRLEGAKPEAAAATEAPAAPYGGGYGAGYGAGYGGGPPQPYGYAGAPGGGYGGAPGCGYAPPQPYPGAPQYAPPYAQPPPQPYGVYGQPGYTSNVAY